METIKIYTEQLLSFLGITGSSVPYLVHAVLVVVAFSLAFAAGWLCRKLLVPIVMKLTRKTPSKWDEVILNERVLRSACRIVPAVVVWQLLPMVFYQFATVKELLARLTAIYITVMMTLTIITIIDSLKMLEGSTRTARQQYLYSFCGVLKIVLIFISAIIVVAIAFNKSPATLLAGLGAASAIMMLAFQDTIKGLVAGIRLTSNDMLHKGDWITVNAAGANGIVEEITLTTVKVRNFDNTIVTVTPQTLVDGSFQNWQGMKEKTGRRQVRKIYLDFRSVRLQEDGRPNITAYREYMEQWLAKCPYTEESLGVMARQAEATQAGMAIEFLFWLKAKDWATFEHQSSEIMEHAYAAAQQFGLVIYQQFPQQA